MAPEIVLLSELIQSDSCQVCELPSHRSKLCRQTSQKQIDNERLTKMALRRKEVIQYSKGCGGNAG